MNELVICNILSLLSNRLTIPLNHFFYIITLDFLRIISENVKLFHLIVYIFVPIIACLRERHFSVDLS